jgi:uncharacterized protein with PIN domain
MNAFYHFHGDLPQLLRPRWRTANPIAQPVTRAASIKDAIEAFGLPHTEVGDIACDGQPVDFRRRVEAGQRFNISPHPTPWDVKRPTILRPIPLPELRFVVDVNAGRLARYLRMAGFDTLYDPCWDDRAILAVLENEPRLLLTRNLELLKRKQVVFGRRIRADHPLRQLREVIRLFGIHDLPHPFSRCLDCNMLLEPVAKQDILPRLEPLTILYVDLFSICRSCDRIYWEGSHVEKMGLLLTQVCP